MKRVQVAVVGAGPAGLSAAIAAASAGAATVLIDEQPAAGGQLRYRIAQVSAGAHGEIRTQVLARQLADEATNRGVDIRLGATVWGLFDDHVLAVVQRDTAVQLQAERIILATGSTDLPLPFPGGSLPGVFTARAIQLLLNLYRVLPGRRFVVVGAAAEAAEVEGDITLAGGQVVARIKSNRPQSLVAGGEHGVEVVWIDGVRHDADVVVIAAGRQPDVGLALMAECAAGCADVFGGWVPLRDGDLQTSVTGIYVCGDAAGTCDVPLALVEGTYAGLSAAASLILGDPSELQRARSTYETAAPSRLKSVEALQPVYVQVERVPAEV